MEEWEPSSMRDLPRVAVSPSEMRTKAAARRGSTRMPPVLRGRGDGVLYPVERPEPDGVLRASRIPRVRAFVPEYGSMTDLLSEHAHR